MIDMWANVWGVVLILVFCVFGLLTQVIGVGAFFDVKAMLFPKDEEAHDQTESHG